MFVPSQNFDPRTSPDGNQPPRSVTPQPWPEVGQPGNSAMPTLPLDPLHDPDAPDDNDVKIELFDCLSKRMPYVKRRLEAMGFEPHIAQKASEKAQAAAVDLICEGDAQKMTQAHRRRWLHKFALNAANTLYRRKPTVPLPDGVLVARQDRYDAQNFKLLLKAIQMMPKELQGVIVALYFEGMSGREAAAWLEIPEATFRRRRDLAIDVLQAIVYRLSTE